MKRNKSTIEEVQNDTKFLGHPRGVGALALGNFCNSAAWGAFYALMIFYLYTPFAKGLGFSQGDAALMISAMGAANGLLGIVGSWLADRVLGMRKALVLGNILKALALFLLAIPITSQNEGQILAYIALILLSMPIMGASNASLTGQLYKKEDNKRRDAAFTIHQFANTAAGIITPVLVGQIGLTNYHIGFAIAGLFAFLYAAVIFFTQFKFFGPLGESPIKPLTKSESKKILKYLFIGALILIVVILALIKIKRFDLNSIISAVTTFAFIIPLWFIVSLFFKKDLTTKDHTHLLAFLWFFAAQIVMALGGTLLTSAIAIFIDQKINRIIFGFTIAPGSVTVIYTVLDLIAGPLFIYLWSKTRAGEIQTIYKYSLGLLVTALGFFALAIPSLILNNGGNDKFSMWWIVVYYVFLAVSDQLVWPIGMSLVSGLSPDAYETQLQTAWGQTASIGNAIAIIFFKIFQTADQQVYLFPIMAISLVVIVSILMIFRNKIQAQMAV